MKKYAILSLMAVLALGACDDDDDPAGTGGTAQVRVVNATTVSGTTTNTYNSVGLFRGTTQVVGGVAASNASGCGTTYTVPAGSQTLHFRATGATAQVGTVTHNFVAGRRYTVVLYGTNNTVQAKVFEEETQQNAAANTRRVRFINASTNATAGDVYATATATTNPTGSATASNIGTGAQSGYFNVANTNNAFRFYNTGTTTTARTSYTLNTTGFPASNNTTVIFTDTGAFQVNNCS